MLNAPFTVPLTVTLLIICSFLLIWQFVGYPLVMGLVALRSKPIQKNYSFQPFISIIVPTYNEEASIAGRIENLYELNYPKQKYEVIVVDSGSLDRTVDRLREMVENDQDENRPPLSVVAEQKRNGKGSAINLAKHHARGEIILVTDANSVFDSDVLREIGPHFEDPKVGAVGGRYAVLNPTNTLTSATQFYWDIEQVLRTGEARLDSACLFHGELNAWRRDLADLDTTMISEDLDMCINIRKEGYKIEYEPRAIVYERAPTSVEEQIRQRKRTSIGTIASIAKNIRYLAVPKDLYRALILPSHKSLVIISPFLLVALPILYLLSYNTHIVYYHSAVTFFAFVLVFALFMRVRLSLIQERRAKREVFTLASLFKVVYFVLLNECIILLAWKDYLLGNYSVLWERTETTRTKSPE